MGVAKTNINGNDYIGAFAVATDKACIASRGIAEHKKKLLEDTLEVKLVETSVAGSNLVGLYVIANSNGILIPHIMYDIEMEAIKHMFKDINVGIMRTDLTALRSNILTNDKVAIVNPDFRPNDIQMIKDVLGVEVMADTVGGFTTVGANNILTNKGIAINNHCSELEKEKIEEFVGMKGEQTTANFGSLHIGLCVVANSKGILFGTNTTGVEESRIANTLDLI